MNPFQFIKSTVLVASLTLGLWLLPLPIQAADQSSRETIPLAPAEELGVLAAGAVEDTLKACLARIPTDASSGQRMMAEQNCEQDERSRTLIHAAPQF